MDLVNYPLHLTPDELEYELSIRGVHNLSTNRLKTTALRELLLKEQTGIETAPKRSDAYNADSEILTAKTIYEEIADNAESALKSKHYLDLPRCVSRLFHLQARLNRIIPGNRNSEENVVALVDSVRDAIVRITRELNSGSQRSVSQLRSSPKSNNSINLTSNQQETRASPSVVDELQQSLRALSDKINALNFSNLSENEGAGVGNLNQSARESLADLGDLSAKEREDMGRELQLEPEARRINNQRLAHGDNIFATQIHGSAENNNNLPVTVDLTRDDVRSRDDRQAVNVQFNRPRLIPRHNEDDRFAEHLQYNTRRSVPVNQWRITFSGDGFGLHLYDFLSQVSLYQRAEGVSNPEMVYSLIHLLEGRARRWYFSACDGFRDWAQVVALMKREFLPANYELLLLTDINNRVQKENESFAEFITHMQSLFKCLTLPLDESHKLFIVQRNLLPRYAMAIAPLELRTLDELTQACRRIDNAALLTNRTPLSMPYSDVRQEVCAVQQRGFASAANNNRPFSGQHLREQTSTCWNCQATGHLHRDCDKSKRGVFCYKCGARDVVTSSCRRCSGNGTANPNANGPVRNSPPTN